MENGSPMLLITPTCIDDLHDELLIEILHRIPCKSAIQCKSVCKQWFHLIQNPYFLSRYFSIHKQKQVLVYSSYRRLDFLTYPSLNDLKLSLSFLPPLDKTHRSCFTCGTHIYNPEPEPSDEEFENGHVLSSSNGFLLCSARYCNQIIYYICNPLTKEWTSIPAAPPSSYDEKMHIGFFCDPYFTVGKDVSIKPNRKFMVVRIPNFKGSRKGFYVQVFRSEKGKWLDFKVSYPQKIRMRFVYTQSAVVLNRKMHWLTSDRKLLVFDPYHKKVDCVIPLPLLIFEDGGFLYLISCRGSIQIYENAGVRFFRIWELNKEKRDWTLKNSFDVGLSSFQPLWLGGFSKRVILVKAVNLDDPMVVFLYFGGTENRTVRVVSLNLRTKRWKRAIDEEIYMGATMFSFSMPSWPAPIPSVGSSSNPTS